MEKVKIWFRKYSKELLVGIVVSLLTTWIIKGFDWLKEFVPEAGYSLFNAFLNSFYSNLAKISNGTLISFALYIALAFYIIFLFNTVLKGFSVSKEKIQVGKEIKNAIESTEKGNTVKEDKAKSKEKTLSQIKNEAEKEIKEGRKIKIIAFVGFFFIVFYTIYIIMVYFVPNIMWETYKRDIVEIKPYVEQQTIDQIESDWVCMKNKEDYENIYKFIDEVKDKHNLP